MIERFVARLFLIFFFSATPGFPHIIRIENITLINEQQVILLFDNKDPGENESQLDPSSIFNVAETIAKKFPNERVELSYADSSIYDAGALPEFEAIPCIKRSSLLSSEFTIFLAKNNFINRPKNLRVRSNDPGREHYLALLKDQKWFLRNADNIPMEDLVLPSRLLRNTRNRFKASGHWSAEVTDKVRKQIYSSIEMDKEHLAKFATYVGTQTIVQYPPARYQKPISYFKDIIDLSVVYDFLLQSKKKAFDKARLMDLTLTLFQQDAPKIMIVIVDECTATQFVDNLDKMGVVKHNKTLPPDDFSEL